MFPMHLSRSRGTEIQRMREESKSLAQLTRTELFEAAEKAEAQLKQAPDEGGGCGGVQAHYKQLGLKALARLLMGKTVDQAVGKWADRLSD